MRLGLLGIVIALLAFGTVQAQSEVPNGAFIKDLDGGVWFVHGTERHRVPIYPASPDQLASIPPSGKWLVPLADGSIVPGERPDWDQTANLPPGPDSQGGAPPDERITVEGAGTKNTDPFWLSGGNYKVRWTARASSSTGCHHTAELVSLSDNRFSKGVGSRGPRGNESLTDETSVYRVPTGNYYLQVISGCSWKITIEPLR